MPKPGKAEKSAARNARLAAALRENLKRRKAQARVRNEGAGTAGSGEDQPGDDAQAGLQSSEFRRNRSSD